MREDTRSSKRGWIPAAAARLAAVRGTSDVSDVPDALDGLDRVNALEFAERYEMLRDHVLEGFADDVVRAVRVPVPGLRWLVRKVVGALEHLVPDEEMAHLREAGGRALVRIDRRGQDLEMRGALGLRTFLSMALSEILYAEAEQRAIDVTLVA